MKKLLLPIIALFLSSLFALNAQNQKRVEHVLEVGGGLSWNDDDTDRSGATLSISYGVDFSLNDKFSVMPMVGYRRTSENMIRSGWNGVSLNDFGFIDFSLSARYRLFDGKVPIVVGVGPYISIIQDRDKYSIDYEPNHSLQGKNKLKSIDFGLMPTISFDLNRHLSVGAKMNIGLTNTSEYYREIPRQEDRYLKSAETFLRFRL